MTTTKRIESTVQDRTVSCYRSQWGYPLNLNQRRDSAVIAVLCFAGCVITLALGLWLS